MSGITSQMETITPDMAIVMIENSKSFRNRHIKQERVKRYAESMLKGHWDLTGQAIIIDENQNVIDGQHRLKACIFAKTPFTTLVVRGVSQSSFTSIDKGAARSMSDTLTTLGEKNSNILASVIKAYLMYKNGMSMHNTSHIFGIYTETEMLEMVTKDSKFRDACTFVKNSQDSNTARFINPTTLVLMVILITEKYGKDKAEEFHNFLMFPNLSNAQNPMYKLREKMIQNRMLLYKASSRAPSTHQELALCIIAFNNWVFNKNKSLNIDMRSEKFVYPQI